MGRCGPAMWPLSMQRCDKGTGWSPTTHPWCLEGPWWGRIEKSDLTKQKKHWIQRMLGYLMQTAGHFMFFKAQPTTDNMVMYNSRSHGGDEKEDTAAH